MHNTDCQTRSVAIPNSRRRGTLGPATRRQSPTKPKALQAILGSRFRTLRKDLGLTQKQAAIALCYHPSKISRMETGDDGCRQEDVRKLLGEYRVDEGELIRYLTWARYAGQSWWPDDTDTEAGSALDALLDTAPVLPDVTLQIIGNAANEPARIGHGFSYLRFADIQLPDLVCIRQLTGVVCLDLPDATDQYLKALDHLAANAATPRRTLEQLAGLRR